MRVFDYSTPLNVHENIDTVVELLSRSWIAGVLLKIYQSHEDPIRLNVRKISRIAIKHKRGWSSFYNIRRNHITKSSYGHYILHRLSANKINEQ
jgi:hypothetical protein